jgi:hypothetical protein
VVLFGALLVVGLSLLLTGFYTVEADEYGGRAAFWQVSIYMPLACAWKR